MVQSYLEAKLTQPDSSNSSDCENSEERIDTILSSLLANLGGTNVIRDRDLEESESDLGDREGEMTIKKCAGKKERGKHVHGEGGERAPAWVSQSHNARSDSLSHFPVPRRPPVGDGHILSSNSDIRQYNYDSAPGAAKRARSVFHNESASNQKITERGSKISDSFNENSGNNSEDEYYMATGSRSQVPFQVEESKMSTLLKEKKGWKIILVGTDGACLFRSVAHQIFGDEEKHMIIREQVINYMKQNREHFSQFISEDFDHYLLRKLDAHTHGNHVEIQAISEIYNRPVEIYYNTLEPINVFHREYTDLPPLRLSYHGGIHYNSIVDPQNPTYGEGLGMPNYQPKLSEPELVEKAKNESETSQIEDTIFQERLKQSENQAIERSIAEQVAQESYLDYLKYLNTQNKSSDSSSLTKSKRSPTLKFHNSPTTSSTAASCSYSGGDVSRNMSQSGASVDDKILRHMPVEVLDMDEDDVLAMVLENSRREYMASLSSSSKERSFQQSVSTDKTD